MAQLVHPDNGVLLSTKRKCAVKPRKDKEETHVPVAKWKKPPEKPPAATRSGKGRAVSVETAKSSVAAGGWPILEARFSGSTFGIPLRWVPQNALGKCRSRSAVLNQGGRCPLETPEDVVGCHD